MGIESLFSRAAEVTTPRRSCLDPEALEQIETLHYYLKGELVDYAKVNQERGEEIYLKDFEIMEQDIVMLAQLSEGEGDV